MNSELLRVHSASENKELADLSSFGWELLDCMKFFMFNTEIVHKKFTFKNTCKFLKIEILFYESMLNSLKFKKYAMKKLQRLINYIQK